MSLIYLPSSITVSAGHFGGHPLMVNPSCNALIRCPRSFGLNPEISKRPNGKKGIAAGCSDPDEVEDNFNNTNVVLNWALSIP